MHETELKSALILSTVGVTACIAVVLLLLAAFPSTSLLIHPGGPHESLCLYSSRIDSPTNMTLNMVNCGYPYTTTLIAYYVKSGQNLYANPNWSGPTIPMNAHASVNILIDENGFTFQSGNQYVIEMVAQRDNQFTFTVTA